MAAARAESLTGSFQRMGNSITFALQQIGGALAPAAKGVADWMTSLGEWVKHLQEFTQAADDFEHGIVHTPEEMENFANKTFLISQQLGEMGVVVKRGTINIQEWHDALMDAAKALQDQPAKLTPVQKGLEALTQKQDDANKTLDTAKGVLDAASAALDGTAEKAQVYNRAIAAYDDAQKKANASSKDYKDTLSGIAEAYDKQEGTLHTLQSTYAQLLASQDGTQRSADLLAETHKKLVQVENQLAESHKLTTIAIQGQGTAFDKLATSADAFLLKETAAAAAVSQAKAVLDQLASSTDNSTVHQRALADAVAQYSHKLIDAGTKSSQLIQFQLNGVTVSMSLKEAIDKLKGAHQDLATNVDVSGVKLTEFTTDSETGEAVVKDFQGKVDASGVSLGQWGKAADTADQASAKFFADMGPGIRIFQGLSDSAAQLNFTVGNSAAILDRNAKALQDIIALAAKGVTANQALQASYNKLTDDVSRAVSIHGELSIAAQRVAVSFGNMSAAEATAEAQTLGLNADLNATTNKFDSMKQATIGSADALQLWASAAAYASSAMATTTPQEGSNGEGTPGSLYDQISRMRALMAAQVNDPGAYIDANGTLIIPGVNDPATLKQKQKDAAAAKNNPTASSVSSVSIRAYPPHLRAEV